MKLRSLFAHPSQLWRGSALLCLASGSLLLLVACSGEEAPADRSAMLPESERVSSVPWNKPQGWENQGALGSLANDPRIGGQQQPP